MIAQGKLREPKPLQPSAASNLVPFRVQRVQQQCQRDGGGVFARLLVGVSKDSVQQVPELCWRYELILVLQTRSVFGRRESVAMVWRYRCGTGPCPGG